MFNDRLRRHLMIQRISDDARALCRAVALQALILESARAVKNRDDVRKALAILGPSLETLEPDERELVASAEGWLKNGSA